MSLRMIAEAVRNHSMVNALAVVCAAIVIRALSGKLYGRSRRFRGLPLPPGPDGWPIVGNVFDMPESHLWEWAADKAKTYGDLMFISNFGQPMLFINSYADAAELLETRSAIYSSRSRMIFARELQGWDWYPAFMPYSEEFRKCRAIIHRFTQSSALSTYIPLQTQEVHFMLKKILEDPIGYEKHVRRFPGAVILMTTYGHKVSSEHDILVELGEIGVQTAADAECMYMVEFFPWMKYIPAWFPGAEFQRRAKKGFGIAKEMLNKPYEMAKQRYLNGSGYTCAVSQLIQDNMDKDGNIAGEDLIASSLGVLYAGGQDTVTTTIMTGLLALAMYPEIQRKAQAELDIVIGKDTLPTFQDRESLPYVNAVCTEALRWHVIAPLGVPHASTEDDEYKGYFIPAGTIVFANAWAMSKNSQEYPNPDEFDPERWLPHKGQPQIIRPENYVFGFGRRMCPGNEFAMNAVFLAISSILAGFNVKKSLDVNGSPIEPVAKYSLSFTRNLKRFECSIEPRNSKIAKLIQQLDTNVDNDTTAT